MGLKPPPIREVFPPPRLPELKLEPIEPSVPEGPQEPQGPSKETTVLAEGRPGEPTGARILHLPVPEYPPRSRRLGEEGLVILEVEVLPDGQVGIVRLLRGSRFPRLVAAAEGAIRQARFAPAVRGGQAVRSIVEIPFRFELQ
ncbi:MAG: TonB family protein [Phycisphaerae bacterium]